MEQLGRMAALSEFSDRLSKNFRAWCVGCPFQSRGRVTGAEYVN